MDNSKRGNIPMQERFDLNKTKGATTPGEVKRMQNVPYASVNPGEPHWNDVKTILKYLRNTKDIFLVYGYVFVLNGGAVDWKSSKQSITAMFTTEAEYIATSEAAMKAVWIRKFISWLVHTDDNLADPFTKALPKGKLTQHARSMRLCLASSFM
ncbi:hypothetical protein Tco_1474842 [Tanacetum coccineum]